jgi:hypothetical protein
MYVHCDHGFVRNKKITSTMTRNFNLKPKVEHISLLVLMHQVINSYLSFAFTGRIFPPQSVCPFLF